MDPRVSLAPALARRLRAAAACVLIAGAAAASGPEVQRADSAILRGLDKIAGTSRDIALQVGGSAMLGPLRITLAECRYPPDDPASEAFAWITVRDERSETVLFDGWMVASSPALNALDHARYDVWVLNCNTD